jgi:hypothetical protein
VINVLAEAAELWQTFIRHSDGGMRGGRDHDKRPDELPVREDNNAKRLIRPNGATAETNHAGLVKQTFRELTNIYVLIQELSFYPFPNLLASADAGMCERLLAGLKDFRRSVRWQTA